MTNPAHVLWPPPGYFWSKNPTVTTRDKTVVIYPLDDDVVVGGTQRYQLPDAPVEPGSVFVDGYLWSQPTGELIAPDGTLAGEVDFITGLLSIDTTVSSGITSRRAQYVVAA